MKTFAVRCAQGIGNSVVLGSGSADVRNFPECFTTASPPPRHLWVCHRQRWPGVTRALIGDRSLSNFIQISRNLGKWRPKKNCFRVIVEHGYASAWTRPSNRNLVSIKFINIWLAKK